MGTVRIADGRLVRAAIRDPAIDTGSTVALAVRPEKIGVRDAAEGAAPGGQGWTVLDAVIEDVHYLGTDTRYRLALGGGVRLVARVQNQHVGHAGMLPRGHAVWVRWRDEHAGVLA
jgi:ABC-type Fe3+/spermidine/putrescine transport system ATPase subunit